MSNPLDRFKGCSSAEVRMGRTPNPSPGTAAYLINTVRMKDNEMKGGFRSEISLTCLWGIKDGQNADKTPASCNQMGDKVQTCLFGKEDLLSMERFHQDFKKFALAAMDMTDAQSLDIANALKANPSTASLYEGVTDELEMIKVTWETALPALVYALNPADGTPAESGVFDGTVAIEIAVVTGTYHVKMDKKGLDDKSNWMHGPDGQPIEKPFENVYFNRKIPKGEIREKLSEDELKRFFGSVEAFEAMDD